MLKLTARSESSLRDHSMYLSWKIMFLITCLFYIFSHCSSSLELSKIENIIHSDLPIGTGTWLDSVTFKSLKVQSLIHELLWQQTIRRTFSCICLSPPKLLFALTHICLSSSYVKATSEQVLQGRSS